MEQDTPPKRAWVAHRPEQRLSIAVNRLLARCLSQPCYFTALHDADGVARTENARARDKTRGVKSGQLDWDIVQGDPHLWRKLELKRGRGDLSEHQRETVKALTACGAAPIVAWTLEDAFAGLVAAGFRFEANAPFVVKELAAKLEAMDREAEAKAAGQAPRKAQPRPKKQGPRYTLGKGMLSRARKAGIML